MVTAAPSLTLMAALWVPPQDDCSVPWLTFTVPALLKATPVR